LQWIVNDDYDSFTQCQPESRKLSRESFGRLRERFLRAHPSDDLVAFQRNYLCVHDLGKTLAVRQLAVAHGIKHSDHDHRLALLLESDQKKLFPTFGAIPEPLQAVALASLRTPLNLGQLLQGECGASALRTKDHADFILGLWHSILDILGAAAHVDPRGSVVCIQPFFESLESTLDALVDSDWSSMGSEELYLKILRQRGRQFGWQVETAEDAVLTRLAAMARANRETAERVKAALSSLPGSVKETLIRELTPRAEGEVLLYYAPAVLQRAGPEGMPTMLTLFARTLDAARAILASQAATAEPLVVNVKALADMPLEAKICVECDPHLERVAVATQAKDA